MSRWRAAQALRKLAISGDHASFPSCRTALQFVLERQVKAHAYQFHVEYSMRPCSALGADVTS